jgi:hypothetical protein
LLQDRRARRRLRGRGPRKEGWRENPSPIRLCLLARLRERLIRLKSYAGSGPVWLNPVGRTDLFKVRTKCELFAPNSAAARGLRCASGCGVVTSNAVRYDHTETDGNWSRLQDLILPSFIVAKARHTAVRFCCNHCGRSKPGELTCGRNYRIAAAQDTITDPLRAPWKC